MNTPGSYECTCREGFTLTEDNITCTDLDECEVGLCSHGCVNLIGGFRCDCEDGYELAGDRTTCIGMFDLGGALCWG